MKSYWKLALSASACAIVAPAAYAQDTGADGGAGIDEIVVTAQKRSETTQRIPMSIDAISAERIAAAGVDDLVAAQSLTPGVVFSRAPDGGVQLTFRGLGTPARNTSFEQSVGGFQDGVFYGSPAMYIMPFFDVERLEFIRGTQGALLGKNTSVGAISIVSRRPGDEVGLNASVSRELELGGWTIEGGVDLPVAEDLSIRLAGYFKDQDGWISNQATNTTAIAEENAAGRITAMWTPPSGVRVTALYQYADAARTGSQFEIVTDDGIFNALDGSTSEAVLDGSTNQFSSFAPNGEGAVDVQNHLATAIIEVPLGENTITSQTSYSDQSAFTLNPVSVPGEEILTERNTSEYNQFSQELRLASPTGGQIEYMLGLYYFHSSLALTGEQFWSVPGFFIPPGQLLNGNWINSFDQKLDSYSGFGNATFHISNEARIAGSLRYTDETKDVVFGRTPVGPATFWNSAANPPFAATPLQFSDKFVNGNINVQYDVTPELMVYASFGRGTKTGGFADSASIPDANPAVSARIESETADTFEAGLKSTLLDRSLILNLAAFRTRVKNYQVTYFDGAIGAFVNLNAPARSQGFEGNFRARVADGIEIDGAATYADAVDRSTGLDLVSAPKWTLDGGISGEWPVAQDLLVSTTLRGHYRSSMFAQFGEGAALDSFETVSASIAVGAEDGGWRVFARAANLFDAEGSDFGLDGLVDPRLSAINANPRLRMLNQPRTVEIGASFSF